MFSPKSSPKASRFQNPDGTWKIIKGKWYGAHASPANNRLYASSLKTITALSSRITSLERAFKTLLGQYSVLQSSYGKMRNNVTTMAVISRRVTQDSRDLEEQVDKLRIARASLEDKINLQNIKIEELTKKLNRDDDVSSDKSDKSEDKPKDDLLSKDARIKAIAAAVNDVIYSLRWGDYNGTSGKLDDLFRPVLELL